MDISKDLLANLYFATMGRTMASAGLDYWTNTGAYDGKDGRPAGTNITTMEGLSANFSTQAEFTALYPAGTTDVAFINQVFQNLFQRDASSTYWSDEIAGGRTTRANAVMSIISGAKGDDAKILENRAAVAIDIADNHVLTTEQAKSKTVVDTLKAITADPASKTAATDTITAITDAGKAFTLTTGTDAGADFLGDADANTYTAAILTLNDGDSLDGGAGKDTLNAEINSAITNGFTSANIENINITSLGSYSVDMKNITGVETFTTVNSAGVLTLNNVASATMALGFKGSDTNNIIANYTSGTLDGSSDKLTLNLDAASAVVVDVDAGFESIALKVQGNSDIDTLTASGAVDMTVSGTGTLDIADAAIDSVDNLTITDTDKITIGDWTGTKSLVATANTGGIVGKIGAASTDGRSDDVLTADSSGISILLGSGADNINVSTAGTLSAASNLVKLGAGDDIIEISGKGAATFVYGEAGDDTIVATANLTSSDLIDGGEGTDTLEIDASTHALLAKGIEKVTLGVDNAVAATSLTFTSIDSVAALSYTNTTAAQDVTVAGLKNGSTFEATKATVKAFSLGFKTGEAATAVADLQKGGTGSITTSNIADATIKLGATSNLTANTGDITLDKVATKLTIEATGAFTMNNISGIATVTDEKLATLSITGTDAITVNDILNDNGLTDVTVKSTGTAANVTVGKIATAGKAINSISMTADGAVATDGGAIVITADSLSSATFTSDSSTVAIGDMDLTKATNDGGVGSITASGKGNTTIEDIVADKLTTLSVTSTNGTATVAKLETILGGSNTGTIGTVTMTAKNEASAAKATTIKADTIGTIKATSSAGDALIANTSTITVAGQVAGDYTDGTVDLIEANGYTAATIGNINADKLTKASATSSTTTAAIGNITDGAANGASATVGTLVASAYTNGSVGTITAAALESVTVSGTTGTAAIGDTVVTNASDTAVVTLIKSTGKGAVTIATGNDVTVDNLTELVATSSNSTVVVGKIDNTANALNDGSLGKVTVTSVGKATVDDIGTTANSAWENIDTISIKSTTGAVDVGDITAADANGFTVTLDAATTIDNGGDMATILNSKGGMDVTLKGGTTASVTEVDVHSSLASDTSVNIKVDASGYAGVYGVGGGTPDHALITSDSTSDSSTMTVKASVGGSFMDLSSEAGSITFYGNAGADAITLTDGGNGVHNTSSTVYAEGGADIIIGGGANDTISFAESTAAVDKFTYDNGGNAVSGGTDTISSFDATSGTEDVVIFSVAAVNAISGVTKLSASHATTSADVAAADAIGLQVVAANEDIGSNAGDNIFVVDGDYTSTSALETALETGGDIAMTWMAMDAGDAILMAYDNGSNTYLATVTTGAITDGQKAAADTLTVTNVITLSGMSDATTLAAANFDAFIA